MSRANQRFTEAEGFGALVTKTTGGTLTIAEIAGGRILADTSSGAIALYLPTPTSKIEMRVCYIANKDGSNDLTIVAQSGASYFGAGATTGSDTATLSKAGEMAIVMAIDGNWYITTADTLA